MRGLATLLNSPYIYCKEDFLTTYRTEMDNKG